MRENMLFASGIAAVAALSACGGGDPHASEAALDEAAAALVSGNGTSLNGTSLNGTSLNGTSLNGTSLSGVHLAGGRLEVTATGGSALADLAGVILQATASDGSLLDVRIDAVVPTESPELRHYAVSWRDGATWRSICGENPDGGPNLALALGGVWNYASGTPSGGAHVPSLSLITFACAGSTLAKCVDLGYAPWRHVDECIGDECRPRSLRSFHQACTRMMRADYCGDGRSHTRDGVPINVWDGLSIQEPAQTGAGWKKEAEWGPSGAVCIDRFRHDPDHATTTYVALHCPSRLHAAFPCFGNGSTFFTKQGFTKPLAARSLLRNEFDSSPAD